MKAWVREVAVRWNPPGHDTTWRDRMAWSLGFHSPSLLWFGRCPCLRCWSRSRSTGGDEHSAVDPSHAEPSDREIIAHCTGREDSPRVANLVGRLTATETRP